MDNFNRNIIILAIIILSVKGHLLKISNITNEGKRKNVNLFIM